MNRLFKIIPLVLGMLMLYSATNAQVIIDYYNLLADYDDDIRLHKLTEKDNQWFTQNSDGKTIKVIVDKKNNFLEIKDKEKESSFSLQICLLKKSNGDKLIALAKNHKDIFLHGEIHILKFRNGRWNDLTEQIMPQINYKEFTEENIGLATSKFNPQLNHELEFGYQLPEQGTTITAQMQTKRLKNKCANNDESVLKYCESLNEIAYTSIDLKWNSKEGIFIVSDKR
ncbi:MAG: hypothetical protein MK207_11290 [Saprospiraceae bacterium]|nr:hypothetical protein [Saprospiraceae bacterium]